MVTHQWSAIHPYELVEAAKELLLGYGGRFTSPPLIRSAIELELSRTLLNPTEGTKYCKCQMSINKKFRLNTLLKAVEKEGVPLSFSTDTIRRLYEWGNRSTHFGYRMPHEQVWFAVLFAMQLEGNVIDRDSKNQTVKFIDQIISRLEKENWITLTSDENR
jgi:hypothetical protein